MREMPLYTEGTWKAEYNQQEVVHTWRLGRMMGPPQQEPTGYEILSRISNLAGLKVGWKGAEWIHLAHDTNNVHHLVITVMNLGVRHSAGKFAKGCGIISLSGRILPQRVS
jgi:hypothetical protein